MAYCKQPLSCGGLVLLSLAVGPAPGASAQCEPVQAAKLVGSDTGGDDRFGTQVAIDGDIAVIGAPWDKIGGVEMGSAYVFIRGPGGWVEEIKLLSPDPQPNAWFGRSVAVDRETIVIGAAYQDVPDDDGAGALFVFTRLDGVWSHRATLLGDEDSGMLGIRVAISGSTIIGGAHQTDPSSKGAAYVFEGSGSTWVLQAKLRDTSGDDVLRFGGAVAIEGDTIVVGCSRREIDDVATGAAYIYTRAGGGWALEQTVWAPDGASMDEFGCSVAVSGDTVLVGALYDDHELGADAGSVYVFRRAGGAWALEAKLIDEGITPSHFGTAVALEGDVAVIGSPWESSGGTLKTGAARIYTRSGPTWTMGQNLHAADAGPSDELGCSAAISNGSALVGAWYDTHPPYSGDAGSAYVFDLHCTCPADLTGDDLVDFTDYLEFLNLYDAGDPRADLNGDGFIDFSDYLAFLNFYDGGC